MSISVVPKEALEKEMQVETISVIIPITERYDDGGEMHQEYKDALSGTGRVFEMIYIVDGGFQKAYLSLKSLEEKGEKLTLIKHSRPFGEVPQRRGRSRLPGRPRCTEGPQPQRRPLQPVELLPK